MSQFFKPSSQNKYHINFDLPIKSFSKLILHYKVNTNITNKHIFQSISNNINIWSDYVISLSPNKYLDFFYDEILSTSEETCVIENSEELFIHEISRPKELPIQINFWLPNNVILDILDINLEVVPYKFPNKFKSIYPNYRYFQKGFDIHDYNFGRRLEKENKDFIVYECPIFMNEKPCDYPKNVKRASQ